jgi:hypothetical protein
LKETNDVSTHSNSFGLLILATFSIRGNGSSQDDQTVQMALFQRSRYVACSLIDKEFNMNSYASSVMASLIHTGVPTDMFLCDSTTEETDNVSLSVRY